MVFQACNIAAGLLANNGCCLLTFLKHSQLLIRIVDIYIILLASLSCTLCSLRAKVMLYVVVFSSCSASYL